MTPKTVLPVLDYGRLFRGFEAPVMTYDCGKKCAPLNGGEPVCCTTAHAVPVMNRAEFEFLRGRSDLWRRFRPRDAYERGLVDDMDDSIVACECKGARHCERENRSLSCRTFPFFPYVTREREFLGLSYYWTFEDRCWVLSNLRRVGRPYIEEFMATYDAIFDHDPEELETMRNWSATMRRVFSRWNRPIPVVQRDGTWVQVRPHGRGIRPASKRTFTKHGPYRSKKAYAKAVREAEAEQ